MAHIDYDKPASHELMNPYVVNDDAHYAGPMMAFANFLESNVYVEYCNPPTGIKFPQEPPSLLDIIELWVCKGDGTTACGTFENFLICVIYIIDDFLTAKRAMGTSGFMGAALWQGNDEHERGEVTELSGITEIHHHFALNRTTWDLAKAGRHRDEQLNAEEAARVHELYARGSDGSVNVKQ